MITEAQLAEKYPQFKVVVRNDRGGGVVAYALYPNGKIAESGSAEEVASEALEELAQKLARRN